MDTFQALADPTRRRILELIAVHGHVSATDISNQFQVSAPAISQHLKVLREAHLVAMEKKAQKRIYHVNPEPIKELEAWIQTLEKTWEGRFDRLEKLLKKEQAKEVKNT